MARLKATKPSIGCLLVPLPPLSTPRIITILFHDPGPLAETNGEPEIILNIGSEHIKIKASNSIFFQNHLILTRFVLAAWRESLSCQVLCRYDQLQILVHLVLLYFLSFQELNGFLELPVVDLK